MYTELINKIATDGDTHDHTLKRISKNEDISTIYTQLEPPSALLKGGRTFQRMSHYMRVPIFFARMGEINLKRGGGGLMQECEGCHFLLLYLQLIHIYFVCAECGKSKTSFITFQFFRLLSQACKIPVQVFQY